jgi:hypothetical protein
MSEKLFARLEKDGSFDLFTIVGNRDGLLGLAEICTRLADLPEDDEAARKLGNHYHFSEVMNNLEPGSVSFKIRYKPDL